MGPSPYFKSKKPRRRSKRIPEFALVALLSVMTGVVIANGSTVWSGITSSLPLSTAEDLSGAARIIDGDTLDISGTRVRLVGIDAPEMDQSCFASDGRSYPCGARAKSHLAALAGHMSIRCDGNEKDRYHRLLATCYAGELNLNAEMVRAGWAVAFRRYSTQYLPEEQIAKTENAGLWQGNFRMPWTWRQGQRTASVEGRDCDIKGNISKNGRIYHLPGSRWYSATRIDEKKGERWFCSESDALAAGWRSPRYD
jgi:endonuclease YncB( thermonuclease family)